MQYFLSKCATWRFLSRPCAIYSSQATLIMASVIILPVSNDNTRVQEGAANGPEKCRHLPWRQKVVNMYLNLSPLKRESISVVGGALAGGLRARRGRHVDYTIVC